MQTVKYTNGEGFECLEDLRGTSTEITLVHMGRETCKPYHAFSGAHDEYVLHFVLSGKGFYSAEGNIWPLTAGQMFLVLPNATVTYCTDKSDPWRYCWLGFRGSKVKATLKECGFSKNRLVLPAPDLSEILTCFDDLFSHIALSWSDVLYRESVLLKVLSMLCLNFAQQCPLENARKDDPESDAYVTQAIEYIESRYMRTISVADIADRVGISRTHLNHVFQKETNLSVQNYLMDFRMQKAASLLTDTSMAVKEISHQVGYSDPLVFSKAFKRKFGISPKQYRAYKDELEERDRRP